MKHDSKRSKAKAKQRNTVRPKKIEMTVENIGIISDLYRALGLIQAVQDTTKGERRATVLQEAIDLLLKHLP